jgi:hypothetical protein
MKKLLVIAAMVCGVAHAQVTYDSSTLVDTNSTTSSTSTVNTNNTNTSTSSSTSTSTVNSTSTATNSNTNYNINSGTQTINNNNSGTLTYNNNNVSSGALTYTNNNTSTSTNTNISSGSLTYNNNNSSTSISSNTNVNQSTSTSSSANVNQNIQSGELTNINRNDSTITQRVIQPPPTAVAPSMLSGGNPDLCTTGSSGSVQTQVFGVSGGGTVRDLNCERLKLSKTLFDMGMKVAAVATMCQDKRVWDAMQQAGTPCPYQGQIGAQAQQSWEANPDKIPKLQEEKVDDTYKKIGIGTLLGVLVHRLF